MDVLVLKTIDSESLGRLVHPGEVVDIPIDEEHVLFKKRYVTFPDDEAALDELEAKGVLKKQPQDSVLLSDRDVRVIPEEDDGTD